MDAIGRRGRFSGVASWTECREQEKSVGGGSVWTQLGRVQRVSEEKDVWHGRFSAWRYRARVPWCRGLGAVLVCVQCGARGWVRARERKHALGVLGGSRASGWHGQGAVHGRSEAGAARGIGHGGQHEAGGEVTGLEVVDVGPARIGVHCRHGDDLGRVRGSGSVSAAWARDRGPAGRCPSIGGRRRRWWSKQKRGKRVLAGFGLRLPSFP
jgi:hypothetical protein